MKAIYQGKLYTVDDDDGDNVHLRDSNDNITTVPFCSGELHIDPTDDEVADAEEA